MASFKKYKNKKGEFWLFQIYLTDPITFEKKTTTRRGFTKLSKAKEAAKKLELQESRKHLNKGIYKPYNEVYQEFREEYSKHLKPSTVYRKGIDFKNWILPYFGEMKLMDITKIDCQNFIDAMAKQMKAYKPIVIQARNVFDFALRNEYIERSPFQNTVYPTKTLFEEEIAEKFWNKEQSTYFLKQLKEKESLKHYALFRTLLLTGLRKGELLALLESDLDITTQQLTVNKTLFYSKNTTYQLLQPKTKSSKRKIYLDDETFEIILDLIRQNKKLRLQFGEFPSEQFIFIKEKSFGPMRNSHINEVLNRYCNKYELPRITVHGLRHSCASLLFAAGVNIKVVQKLLGHEHLETTMNIYTHVTEEQIQDTSQLLNNYLKSDSKISSYSQNTVKYRFKNKKRP